MSDLSILYRLKLADTSEAEARSAFSRLYGEQVRALRTQRPIVAQLTSERDRYLLSAQKIAAAEQTILKTLLAQRAALQLAGTGGKGVRDPLGKRLGGARGGGVTDMGDLLGSFTTLEGVAGRFTSLFAGQIGTLYAFNLAMELVTGSIRGMVSAQSELMSATAKLSVVLEPTFGRIEDDLKQLEYRSRQWSRAFGQSAAEILESQYSLAAAGLRSEEILRALPGTALLAAAGFISLAESAEIVSTQFQVFKQEGLSAIDIANLIQETADESQVTVAELGNAMRYVSGTAEASNLTFRETLALLGTLGTLGLRGSIAGTSLNQALSQIAAKKDRLRELGIVVEDVEGQLRPFTEVLAEFQRVFGQDISAGEQKLLTELFDIRGARAVQRLITDVTILPRMLQELENSQTSLFEKSERGADTLAESWRVAKNQLVDFATGTMGIARGLQAFFDAFTGRKGLRTLETLTASAAGAQYEIEKLTSAMDRGSQWALVYAAGLQKISASLPEELRELVEAVDTRPQMFDDPETLAALDRLVAGMREWRLELERIEDLRSGAQQLETAFGFMPRMAVTAREASDLLRGTVEEQRKFVENEYRLLLESLGNFMGPLTRDSNFAEDFLQLQKISAALGRLGDDTDAARGDLTRQLKDDLIGMETDLAKARLELLKQTGERDYEARAAAISRGLSLKLAAIESVRAKQAAALKEEIAASRATGDEANAKLLDEKLRKLNAIAAIQADAKREEARGSRADLSLSRLQREYDLRSRIGDLEIDLERERLAPLEFAAKQRARELESISEFEEFLRKKVDLEKEERVVADDLLRIERLRFAISEEKRADLARKEAAKLNQINSERVLAEARFLASQAGAHETLVLEKDYWNKWLTAEEQKIRSEEEFGTRGYYARLMAATDEYIRNKKRLETTESEYVTSLRLGEVALLSDAFTGLAQLQNSLGESTTAAALQNFGRIADGVGSVLTLYDKLASQTISGLGFGLGVVGIVSSLVAGFMGSRRSEQEDIRRLAEEFRSGDGRSVSADFGRAQVINARIEVNAQYRSLTAPNAREQQILVEELGPEILEELRNLGARI
ncbi:phage tail tape measure protein [bacterium]|nr:phage tail tape measure protein [bacterium]